MEGKTDLAEVSGGSACFLVKEKDLQEQGLRLEAWLQEHDFRRWQMHGWYENVDWVYINLNTKVYAPGLPGIPLCEVVGNHAVTFAEFRKIYEIYEKYEGTPAPLAMEIPEPEEEDDCGQEEAKSGSSTPGYSLDGRQWNRIYSAVENGCGPDDCGWELTEDERAVFESVRASYDQMKEMYPGMPVSFEPAEVD